MTIPTYRSSRPAECVEPRPHTDPSQRFATYGKVQPMDDLNGQSVPFPLFRRIILPAVLCAAVFWMVGLLFHALTGG